MSKYLPAITAVPCLLIGIALAASLEARQSVPVISAEEEVTTEVPVIRPAIPVSFESTTDSNEQTFPWTNSAQGISDNGTWVTSLPESGLGNEPESIENHAPVFSINPNTTGSQVPVAGNNAGCRSSNGCGCCWANCLEMGVDSVFLHGESAIDDFASSGRFWIGYQINPVYSLRTRFWLQEYDAQIIETQNDIQLLPAPATGDFRRIDASFLTDISSLDFELRRMGYLGPAVVESFFGVKYAEFDSRTTQGGSIVDLDTDEFRIVGIDILSELQGLGFSFGFDSVIPFRCAPRFGLVANLNGAIIGGNNRSTLQFDENEFVAVGGDLVPSLSNSQSVDGNGGGTAWVGHAQVGVQYSRPVACRGGATFTARGLFEFQTWAQEDIEFFVQNTGVVPINVDRELIGFSFGIGFER